MHWHDLASFNLLNFKIVKVNTTKVATLWTLQNTSHWTLFRKIVDIATLQPRPCQLLRQYLQAIFSDSLHRFVSSSPQFTETTTLPKSFNLTDKTWWNSTKLFSENQGIKEMDDSTSAFYHNLWPPGAMLFPSHPRTAWHCKASSSVSWGSSVASLLDGAKPCPVGHRSILTKVVVHHYDNLILIVNNPTTIPEGPNNVIVKPFTSL